MFRNVSQCGMSVFFMDWIMGNFRRHAYLIRQSMYMILQRVKDSICLVSALTRITFEVNSSVFWEHNDLEELSNMCYSVGSKCLMLSVHILTSEMIDLVLFKGYPKIVRRLR